MEIADIVSGLVALLGGIGVFYTIYCKMKVIRTNTDIAKDKAQLELDAAKAKSALEIDAATIALKSTDSLAFRDNLFNQINTLTTLLNLREKHIEDKDKRIDLLITQNTELMVEVGKLRSEVEHLTEMVAANKNT